MDRAGQILVKISNRSNARGGQASMAGLIIGAGGRTKTRIEQDSGARMQVRRPRRRRAFLRWV